MVLDRGCNNLYSVPGRITFSNVIRVARTVQLLSTSHLTTFATTLMTKLRIPKEGILLEPKENLTLSITVLPNLTVLCQLEQG